MQKISRIYIGGYGVKMAWFEGLTIDLNDPHTKNPTDTILSLENGGGKTTLLSFVLSCFDPPVKRFVKHLQNENHKFNQYFSPDGRPGIVLVEWKMPPRAAGANPYYIVIGQVAANRPGTDGEMERFFFSFESSPQFDFGGVPVKGVNMAPLTTMSAFREWRKERLAAVPDFYYTEMQEEWVRHLREVRLIDVDMLRLQVDFSRTEGGIDSSFLNFRSESDFLRKLLTLTLDEELTEAVRKTVVDMCDKLRNKGKVQKSLEALEGLNSAYALFDEEAKRYVGSQQTRRDAEEHAAILAGQLDALAVRLNTRKNTAAADAERLQAEAQMLRDQEKRNNSEALTLEHMTRQRAAAKASAEQDAATADHDAAKTQVRLLKAAQAKSALSSAERELEAAQMRVAAEDAPLEALRKDAKIAGAKLRAALYAARDAQKNEAEQASNEAQSAQGECKAKEEHRKSLTQQVMESSTERASLAAKVEACQQAQERLIAQGVLHPGEAALTAANRHKLTEAERSKAAQQHRQEAARLHSEAEACRKTRDCELKEAEKAKRALEIQTDFLAKAEAARQELLAHPAVVRAVEGTEFDLEDLSVRHALDRAARSDEAVLAQCAVDEAGLHADKISIREAGVRGVTGDIGKVVETLRQAGIRSATPFATYLANIVLDADTARGIVESNPARFLGVTVSSSELAKAKELLAKQELLLSAPVMVSENWREAEHVSTGDRFVVSAGTDAAFSKAAAQALLAQVDAKLAAVDAKKKAYADSHREVQEARVRLSDYLEKYNARARERATAEAETLRDREKTARARADEADAQAAKRDEQAACETEEANKAHEAASIAKRQETDVRAFHVRDESGQADRLERIAAIEKGIEAANAELGQCEEKIKEAQSRQQKANTRAETHRLAAKELERKANKLELCDDSTAPPDKTPLTELETAYENAYASYKYAGNENARIAILKQQETEARSRWSAANNAFSEFRDRPESEYEAYLDGSDLSQRIEAALKEALDAKERLHTTRDTAAKAQGGLDEFERSNPSVVAPTPELEALEDLGQAIDERRGAAKAARAAATLATENAARKKEEARDADNSAKRVEQSLKSLRSTLGPVVCRADAVIEDTLDEQSFDANVSNAIERLRTEKDAEKDAREKARTAFDAMRKEAARPAMQDFEPMLARAFEENDFEDSCADSGRLMAGLADRLEATRGTLESMKPDFEKSANELMAQVERAARLLNAACTERVPEGVDDVGGKCILKMSAKLYGMSSESRRADIERYLDTLIETGVVPEKGAELVARALTETCRGTLNLQILKMVPDENQQYAPVDKIQNSGGEGVTMAMFLYMLVAKIRAKEQVELKKTAGGPLILDNPFAKATTKKFWAAIRKLAQALDVQLIFATAQSDPNTMREFEHFVRIRKIGTTPSGRWHLEAVKVDFNPALAKEAA